MSLNLFNSLSQKKETFKPINKNQVLMYVCGITPYDTTHLGHAFAYIHFDVLFRYLKYLGYRVNYTQNVTDIDDDILKKAKEEKKDWQKLGDYWTDKFLNDLKALNIQIPSNYVKATSSIPTILNIISKLIKDGFAYEKGGNVYFDFTKYKNYGKLSKLSLEEMIKVSAQRGADPNDPLKRNPLDFILWQKSKEGEPSWDSPWSAQSDSDILGKDKGRPGWHIECSAMNFDYLGEQIDIHGGGKDLIFPHHESEIAQIESYTGKSPFAKYWIHVSMVKYLGEKMSKSLGNLVMVSDLLREYHPNVIRFLLLSNHYRKKWEFELTQLKNAKKAVEKIENNLPKKTSSIKGSTILAEEFLNDDLNTPDLLESLLIMASQKKELNSLHSIYNLMGFKISG